MPPRRLFARRWLETVVCSLAVATCVFGLSGFVCQYASSGESPTSPSKDWTIPIFKTVQLFLLNSGAEDDPVHPSNWLLAVARLSAATLFLVVSSAVIWRFLENVRNLPRRLRRKDHFVICGLGQIGLQILDDLRRLDRSADVVIIDIDPLNAWADYARSRGAVVVFGDSTKADTLNDARALYAREVFVVTGDDGVNLEVVAELGRSLRSSRTIARIYYVCTCIFSISIWHPPCGPIVRS